jgi:hypothetical protein
LKQLKRRENGCLRREQKQGLSRIKGIEQDKENSVYSLILQAKFLILTQSVVNLYYFLSLYR